MYFFYFSHRTCLSSNEFVLVTLLLTLKILEELRNVFLRLLLCSHHEHGFMYMYIFSIFFGKLVFRLSVFSLCSVFLNRCHLPRIYTSVCVIIIFIGVKWSVILFSLYENSICNNKLQNLGKHAKHAPRTLR